MTRLGRARPISESYPAADPSPGSPPYRIRRRDGNFRAPFLAKFGVALEQVFASEIEFLVSRGLMELGEHALSLTPEGVHYKNGIIPLFAAPSIQAYLIGRDPTQADDMTRNRKIALRVAG